VLVSRLFEATNTHWRPRPVCSAQGSERCDICDDEPHLTDRGRLGLKFHNLPAGK
jgi:hypothetical protein